MVKGRLCCQDARKRYANEAERKHENLQFEIVIRTFGYALRVRWPESSFAQYSNAPRNKNTGLSNFASCVTTPLCAKTIPIQSNWPVIFH